LAKSQIAILSAPFLYPDSVPELPEVETIARGLDKRIAGYTVESVWIGSRKQPLKSPAAVIAATLEGVRIRRVHRAGKHIVFDLERAALSKKGKPAARDQARQAAALQRGDAQTPQWIVHLGMTGRMVVCEASAEIPKHTHLIAKLASGRELRFIDPRMFGKLSVHSGGFDPGGVEPLEVSEERFVALFRGRKTPIKSALLNQKLLSGVGNIYADESLFRAGIRPRRRGAAVTRAELQRLHIALKAVLREAIKLGGSSANDYVDAEGQEAFFHLRHRVYGKQGGPYLLCGAAIKRVIIARRSSH